MTEEKKSPRLEWLRYFLFHNFWLKLLAFALAVIIYLTLRSGITPDEIEKNFREGTAPNYSLEDKLANAER